MEGDNTSVDLLDDLWIYIFSFVPFRQRISLAQISSRWQKLSRNPLAWHTVEISLADSDVYEELESFLSQYNGSVVDLNVEVQNVDDYKDTLDSLYQEIFTIKSLRRLALIGFRSLDSLAVPLCKELKFLHLDAKLSDAAAFNLLSGLPNLEELYLADTFQDPDAAIPKNTLTKLQRLGFFDDTIDGIRKHMELIVAALPSLKYLIFAESEEPVPPITHINNTIVIVTSEAFKYPMNFDVFKQIVPILVPYPKYGCCESTLSAFVQEYGVEIFVEYMVKELGYDLNAKYPEFSYRPSFLESDGKSEFPIEVAIEQGDIDLVKQLMALGATLECPDPNESYLRSAKDPHMCMFLLQNGVDPNKTVKVRFNQLGPAFLLCLIDGKDSKEVPTFLRDQIDVNTKWHDKSGQCGTAIGWFDMLTEAGIKLETSSLRTLFLKNHNRFYKVMNSDSYYEDDDMKVTVPSKNLLYLLSFRNARFPEPAKHSNENTETEQKSKYWAFEHKTHEQEIKAVLPAAKIKDKVDLLRQKEKVLKREEDILEDLPSLDDLDKILQAGQLDMNEDKKSSSSEDFTETQNTLESKPSTSKPDVTPFQFDSGLEDSTKEALPNLAIQPIKFTFNLPQVSTPVRTNNSFSFNLSGNNNTNFFEEKSAVKPNLTAPIPSFAFTVPQLETEVKKKEEEKSNEIENESVRIFNNSYEKVLQLMKNKVNDKTKRGLTPLLCVCRSALHYKDKEFRIKALLKYGADVNLSDDHLWTPLHAVCYSGDWPLVELLINNGARLNVQDEQGITPLAAAVYGLHVNSKPFPWYLLSTCPPEVFKLTEKMTERTLVHLLATVTSSDEFKLIINKFDINVRDAMGYTPLHYAIYFGNMKLAKFLLKSGSDPNIQTTALKVTPTMLLLHLLTFATVNENEYYLYFRSQMTLFNCRPRTKVSRTPYEFASTIRPPWHISSRRHKTSQIHRTIKLTGALQTLDKLLEKSDPSLVDSEGNSLLHLYVRYHPHSAFQKFFSQPDLWARKNDVGDSPFVMACRSDSSAALLSPIDPNQSMLHIVKKANIDLNEQDSQGYSPIHYVLNHEKLSYFPIKKNWLESMDSISANKQGLQMTELDYCLNQTELNFDLFLGLLKKTNLLSSRDHLGRTLLMRIIIRMREKNAHSQQSLKLALELVTSSLQPSDLDAQDVNGDTAMHIVCKYFHYGSIEAPCKNLKAAKFFFRMADQLLSSGVDTGIKNKKGETPMDYIPNLNYLFFTHGNK